MSLGDTAARAASTDRGLERVITLPPAGPDSSVKATQRFTSSTRVSFVHNDPFIMLADDRVDLPRGRRAGGPHPHAGFEIMTFGGGGEARDRDEGLLQAADVLPRDSP